MAVADQNVVLVTGGNTGIGYEICKKLASEQANYHILMGTRSLQKGTEAAASLSGLRSSVQPIQIDVTDDSSISSCVSAIEKQFGRLDVLINNAGIDGRTFANTSMSPREKYYAVFDTNVFGTACLTDTCIPLLEKKAEVPRVVFVSSSQGSLTRTLDPSYVGYRHLLAEYKPSKAAMITLSAIYAVKYGPEGLPD